MKIIGVGLVIYASDFEDRLPVQSIKGLPTAVGWAERIDPYTKDELIFRDPQDREGEPYAAMSYALNANSIAFPHTEVTTAARSVLLFEIANARAGRKGKARPAFRQSPVGDGAIGGLLDSIDPDIAPQVRPATGLILNSGLDASAKGKHHGKANYTFLDLHVRHLAPGEVSAGANATLSGDDSNPSGGFRPDLPGRDRPRAEGTGRATVAATFSLR